MVAFSEGITGFEKSGSRRSYYCNSPQKAGFINKRICKDLYESKTHLRVSPRDTGAPPTKTSVFLQFSTILQVPSTSY